MYVENEVRLGGNLTRDPELRQISNDNAVTDFGIAVNRRGMNGKDEVLFIDITCWGKTAENCAKFLHKGSNVAIKGRLVMEQWTGKDGTTKSKLKVTATEVQFVSPPKSAQQDESGSGNNNYQPRPYSGNSRPATPPRRGVPEEYAPPVRNQPDDYADDGDELPPF